MSGQHIKPAEVEGLVERMTRITRYKYASRNQQVLNCELGTICLGDVDDLCAALAALQAENERMRNWQDHNANEVPRLQMRLDAANARAETAEAERDALRSHIAKLEAYALDMDRRLMRKGSPKWIPLHTEEIIQDIAEFENEKLKGDV